MRYRNDYPQEPIGGGNPYYRCVHCHRSGPEINGSVSRHEPWCAWRKMQFDSDTAVTARGIMVYDAVAPTPTCPETEPWEVAKISGLAPPMVRAHCARYDDPRTCRGYHEIVGRLASPQEVIQIVGGIDPERAAKVYEALVEMFEMQ
jgi:hypothetical protein